MAQCQSGERLVIAVADGLSAAKQSHIGSTAAARYAVQWLINSLPASAAATDWQALVESTAWALVEQASVTFGSSLNPEDAERLLATTLTCAVVEPNDDQSALVHVVSVGDSGAWILADGVFTGLKGGKAESDGLTTSVVAGLPRVPTNVRAVSVPLRPEEVLVLATDGFGDPLGSGGGEVGKLFSHLLGGNVPSMIQFAHALDFSRETFDDDRTLVGVWCRSERSA